MKNKRNNSRFPSPAASFLFITVLTTLLIIFWPGSAAPDASEPGRPKVGATIFPLYDIVRNVAGADADVVLLTPPAASPHTFEPRPSELRSVKGAGAIYAVGHGLDDWVAGLGEAAGVETVIVDRGINLLRSPDADAEHDGRDPHYWLDPANAALIAANVTDDLGRRFPASAAAFRRNLEAYLGELDETDGRIRDLLADLPNRDIVTLHDAWYYFARAYDLNIVGSFEPTAGREPTPQYLAALQRAVTVAQSRTLYAEPQLSTQSLAAFTGDNGLTIVIIDPVGGGAGRGSYVELMLYNARIIRENQR